MVKSKSVFSGFSVDDIAAAKSFYGNTVGLKVEDGPMGVLNINLPDGGHVMVYPKPNHQPATYTMLSLVVSDIEQAVDDLTGKGVEMERYDMPELKTDEKGIARSPQGGPTMAWFKDPAGNIVGVLEEAEA